MSLVDVSIETKLGAKYVFPDVLKKEVTTAVSFFHPGKTLTLVNASGAYLSMPCRIIQRISVDKEDLWLSPA